MSKISTEYIMSAVSFENRNVHQVFKWNDETPVIYRVIGGVIVGNAPGKVFAHQLKADSDRCLMAVNTLVMLTCLNLEDTHVTICKGGQSKTIDLDKYEVPTDIGMNILCESTDAIYTDAYSKARDKRGFKRQITDFNASEHILKFEYDNPANDKPLYDETNDAWNGVLNPTELKNFFESYKLNSPSQQWTYKPVVKRTYLLSDFNCFYTGEHGDKLVTMSDSIGGINSVYATTLGIVSMVNVESMFTEVEAPSAEEIYTFISKGISSNDEI